MGRLCDFECLLQSSIEVPYRGPQNAEIVVVGESPGRKEIEAKPPKAFIGPAGNLLWRNWNKTNLPFPAVLNSARCMIVKDALSQSEIRQIISTCRPKVEQALHAIEPKLIITLGDIALRQVLKRSGITKNRGKFFWSQEFDCWVLPTFHPAYCLRNPAMEPRLLDDLRRAEAMREQKYEEITEDLDYYEWDDLEELLFNIDNNRDQLVISYDVEATGLDPFDSNTLMICFGVSCKSASGRIVNLFWEVEDPAEEDYRIKVKRAPEGGKRVQTISVGVGPVYGIRERLRTLYELLDSPNYNLVMQNGNYDRAVTNALFRRIEKDRPALVTWEKGRPPSYAAWVMDTQAAAHCLNENLWTMARLEDLQFAFTDMREDYSEAFRRNYSYDDLLNVDPHHLRTYQCGDVDATRRVAIQLRRKLLKNKRLCNYYDNLVQPVLKNVLFELEQNGTVVDVEALPGAKEKVANNMGVLSSRAMNLIPRQIKANHERMGLKLTRRELVRDALFDIDGFGINLSQAKKTKTGEFSLDKEARTFLLESRIPKRARELLEIYEEWLKLHTLYTRYLNGFEKHVKSDGRVHSKYSIVKTVTGRIASSNPNMQNVPKRDKTAKIVRRLLAAPPGMCLIEIDLSQAELRWAAHVSRDKTMLRVFRAGADLHAETAMMLSKKKRKDMDDAEWKRARFEAKAMNFGLLYLMSAPGFVHYAKQNYKLELTLNQSKEWIAKFFKKYPGLRRYHQETLEFCRKHGYVVSPLGRRRHLPEINSRDDSIRLRAEKQAVNHPIQSASSDTALLAANTLLEEKLLDPDECRLVNFIHDSLVFECVDDYAIVEKNIRIISHTMENPPLELFDVKLRVPMVADASVGYNLAEMNEVTDETFAEYRTKIAFKKAGKRAKRKLKIGE